MMWETMLFRGKDEVLVRCDDKGVPIQEAGRVEMRYTDGGKIYRASARNVETLSGPRAAPASTSAPIPDAERAVAYTDGACSGNPGPAGLGVVLRMGGELAEISEYLGRATNNVAELSAILRAAERIAPTGRAATIYCDSTYAIGVLTKGWKAKANQELVAKTKRALSRLSRYELVKVPGHAGVPDNELADQLAVKAVKGRA